MKVVNQSDLAWVEVRSPGGRFQVDRRHLSEALGAPRDATTAQGGHPFEVELARIPPGATNCPYHAHAAQWEFYVILSGTGEVRGGEALTTVGPGDSFIFPPGEAHQLRNTGGEDLVYYVIADNPPADVITYPDTGKWFVKPHRKSFRMVEEDYYAGEE